MHLQLSFISVDPPLDVQMHSRLYNIKDGITCKLALRVKHGTSKIVALMDRVSNEDFNAVSESQK